ncbi:Uu.00g003800.m01.CDS01 [Anthostomella pinea]|uniref:Dynactin subunit 4 n=1 Tax=Anthostomella pinea TaxID=933095 RepID=A0AAI8VKY8_9PEZI|nr:Uu.00g003800.m01.CDS01 [Anthostomella pinea]
MASFTPYTYIQCPCHDTTTTTTTTSQSRPAEDAPSPTSPHSSDDDDDDHNFDPRAPRSNYSLYPLEYLLWCDVCHQIRCPRCVAEELVTIYCPNCLFEVASSSLKTEGNRCTRSCFQCPICIGPLAVQSLESAPEPSLLSADNANTATTPAGPWILSCSYCNWNSSEIGVKFDKPQGIFAQLQKLRHGEDSHSKHAVGGDTSPTKTDSVAATMKARFSAMRSFYSAQNAIANPSSGLGDYGFSSPGALSRIMSIYSGNNAGSHKQKSKGTMTREADSASEGFRALDLDDSSAVSQLRRDGWDSTVIGDQAKSQVEEGARFAEELWPIPYLLRTKRSKRCPVCRHIISKPESKVANTRFRMRLVANTTIPSISIKPFNPPPALLKPLQPVQYLLTFRNPLFDEVKVTLATPATTPGRFASRVTVLCPQFQMDPSTESGMYLVDDALKDDNKDIQGRRRRGTEGGTHQAEAGKIWERGHNWVTIVVEVVPASLSLEAPPALLRKEGEPEPDLSPLKEDEDVLEIPMFVRLEWEGDVSHDQMSTSTGKEKDAREKKELAYWCTIGIGRISQE